MFESFDDFEKQVKKIAAQTYNVMPKERVEQLEAELLGLKINKEYFNKYKSLYETKKKYKTNKNGLIVPFLLGITNVDPLASNLNPVTWVQEGDSPDIDSDCEDRDRVLEILREQFESDGVKRVAPISNFNAITIKAGIKDIARFHNIPFQDVNLVTKAIPDKILNKEGTEEIESKLAPLDLIRLRVPEVDEFLNKYIGIEKDIELIKGQYRNISRHAGGVAIADSIDAQAPLYRSRGIVQTGFTDGISSRIGEEMGFIKFDLLGLGTLRIISDCIHDILTNYPERWQEEIEEFAEDTFECALSNSEGSDVTFNPFEYTSSEFKNIATKEQMSHRFKFIRAFYENILHPALLDLNDQEVYKNVYQEGRFVGVFQMESEGMRKCTKSFVPNCIEDIFAAVAIYRPGPLAADVDKLYAEYKKKAEQGSIRKQHPIIDRILEPSYGLLIYQEQLMALAGELGGLSKKDVQKFRKVISKKKVKQEKEWVERVFNQYIESCKSKNFKREKALKLWEDMLNFGEYAFNLAHSASYGIMSYITAWLLTYYKYEWYTAVLNNSKKDDLERNILEIVADGVTILPPDIIQSKTNWTYVPEEKAIRFGLSDVKGVGAKAGLSIIEARKKKSFDPNNVFSFFQNEHIDWRNCNKAKVSSLVKVGAFDRYEPQIIELFEKWSVFDETVKEHKDIFQKHGKDGVKKLKEKREAYLDWKRRKEIYEQYIAEGGDKNNKDYKPGRRVSKTMVFWDLPEWTKKDKIEFYSDLLNFIPVSDDVKKFLSYAEEMQIQPIDNHLRYDNLTQPVWFRVMSIEEKKTKKGNLYYRVSVMGKNSVEKINCFSPEQFTANISDFAVAYLQYSKKWDNFSMARNKKMFVFQSI